MNTIHPQWPRASRLALAACAAVLLPLLASADSQLAGTFGRGALKATAHLDFKIVIPSVLSMDVPGGIEEPRGARTVAIYTNNHNATLAATDPASELARGNIILSSAARKVISQNVGCATGRTPVRARIADAGLTCTASMP